MNQQSNQSHLFPFFIILIVIFGFAVPAFCQPKQVFDLSKHWDKEENFPLSEIGQAISYIPLETKKECFLPKSSECGIRLTNDYFLVISQALPIFIFSRHGKFLWKVGEIGKGPREIPGIDNVVVNPRKEWVAIKSNSMNKVLIYSLKGKFVREFNLDPGICKIFEGPSDDLVGINIPIRNSLKTNQSLQYYSELGDLVKTVPLLESKIDLKEVYADYIRCQVSWKDDLPIIIEKPYFDGYELNNSGNWTVGWHIDTPSEPATQILSVRDIGGFLYIDGANPYEHIFIASKSTGQVSRCSFSIDGTRPDIKGLYNDLDGGLPIWPRSKTLDNEMVTMFDAAHLIDYAKGELPTYGGTAPKIQQSFKDMAAKLTYEDNPVVAVVRLKSDK